MRFEMLTMGIAALNIGVCVIIQLLS